MAMPSFAVSSSTVKRRNSNFRFAVVSVTGMMFLGNPNRNRPMLKSSLERQPEFNPSSITHSTMPIGQGSRLAQGKSKNWLPAKGCSITHCCLWAMKCSRTMRKTSKRPSTCRKSRIPWNTFVPTLNKNASWICPSNR